MIATGGGPSKAVPLNQAEEKLMAIMRWKSVNGDANKELGITTNSKDKRQYQYNNFIYSTATVTIEHSINNIIMIPAPSTVATVPSSTSVHPFKTNEMVITEVKNTNYNKM